MANFNNIPGNTPIPAGTAIIRNGADTAFTNRAISNVDNTSDFDKPVSTAQQAALDLKENLIGFGTDHEFLDGEHNWTEMAEVALTGDYNDLSNRPSIPGAQVNSDWNSASGVSQILNKPSLATVATTGAYADLSGKPSLATVATSGSYNDLTNKPTIGTGSVTSVGVSSTDFSVSGSPITTSGSFTLNLNTSGVTPGTYTSLTVNNKGIATAGTVPSVGSASRSLNSAFQISATRMAMVSYSVDIATTVNITSGQVGTVYLEYADDSGFTTGVTEVSRFVNGNTGTIVVGLTLNQTNTAPVGGLIPAGKYVRLRTQNNTSTPTFTYRSGQEVLL